MEDGRHEKPNDGKPKGPPDDADGRFDTIDGGDRGTRRKDKDK